MTQQKKDDRPLMGLGHLVIPNVSASQDWLKRQADDRNRAVQIVAKEASDWFDDYLPEESYAEFAERVVAALDQRI